MDVKTMYLSVVAAALESFHQGLRRQKLKNLFLVCKLGKLYGT